MNATGLRELLADAGGNGAYFVDARDREALLEAAASLRFAVARIDLSGCRDKAQLLAQFALALRFPDWFGGNWDALADCLDDLAWWPADGYVLLIDGSHARLASHDDDLRTLLDILDAAAASWAQARTAFWALLPLPAHALAELAP